jgi:hypothetical protein
VSSSHAARILAAPVVNETELKHTASGVVEINSIFTGFLDALRYKPFASILGGC